MRIIEDLQVKAALQKELDHVMLDVNKFHVRVDQLCNKLAAHTYGSTSRAIKLTHIAHVKPT